MKRKLRAGLSMVCGVVGVVALVAGVVYVFIARSLFNADMFADRVSEGLAQPAIARIIADQLTDQIIEQHRDLIPYRPLIGCLR